MIEKISYILASKLSNNIINDNKNTSSSQDEVEVLQYGFECIINTIIPLLFYIAFSIILDNFIEMIIWVTLFLLLRNYIGGFHASSHTSCIILSTLYGIICLLCIRYTNHISIIVEVGVCVLLLLFQIKFGIIIQDTDLQSNYAKFKHISILLIIFETLIILCFNFLNINYHIPIFISIVSAEFLFYVEIIKLHFMN